MRRESPRDRRRERARRVRERLADDRLQRAAAELYPDYYTGAATGFGLEPGPCIYERKWGPGGAIIRTVDGRRWTVAKADVTRDVQRA